MVNKRVLRPEVSEKNFADVFSLAGNPVNASFDFALALAIKNIRKKDVRK